MLKRLLIFLAVALLPAQGWSQATVLQGGSWTAGSIPMYSQSGGSQPIVQNSGTAAGGGVGVGVKELNLTARGTGTAPYASQGTGQLGTIFQIQDAPTTNSTGYHALSMSANAQGGGLIAYNAYGSASPLPLTFNVNGQTTTWPPSGSSTQSCTPIENYGGGIAIADNVAAFNAFVAGQNLTGGANQGCLAFGAGRYTFLSGPTVTLAIGASVSIKGAGPEQSQLYFPNGSGIAITGTTSGFCPWRGGVVSVENVAFLTGQTDAGVGLAIQMDNPGGCPNKPTTISRTYYRGVDQNTSWGIGLKFTNTQNASVDNFTYYGVNQDYMHGIGIQYNTDVAFQTTVLTVYNAFVTFANIAIDAEGYFQGVEVTNSNLNRVNYGLYCNAPIPEPQCSMSNSAAEAEITAVYWNNIVGSSLTGNLLYIGVLASADERPGITMLGASNNNMIVGNEVGCNTHGGFQANGINYQTGTAYHTTTGNVFQGCKISLLYDAGASKNLDASNVNINGTYVTDNGTANNHDWVDTAGLYRSSYKYFDAGLQGGAVKITANVNGGIVMGASGKAPFLDFVCDGRSFCGRLQQVGAGAIEFETTTGPLGGTFVDGTAGGTPVNQIRITSTATGVAPTVLGAGTDATVDLSLGCQNHGSCAVKIPNDPLNIAVPITGNGIQLGAWLYQTNNINSVGVDLSASFDHGLAIGWNQAGNGEVNYVASSTVANTWSHRFQSWFGSTLKLAPVNASYFQTSNIVTVTDATYTVDVALDYAIIGNRAGTITLTLPNPVTYPGRSLEIKTIQAQTIVSNASNVVPVDGGGAGTAIIAATAGKWAILRSNGTSWIIMASN